MNNIRCLTLTELFVAQPKARVRGMKSLRGPRRGVQRTDVAHEGIGGGENYQKYALKNDRHRLRFTITS